MTMKSIETLTPNARMVLEEIIRYKVLNGLSIPLPVLEGMTGLCRNAAVAARFELIAAGLIERTAPKYVAIVGERVILPDWCMEVMNHANGSQ